MSYGTLNSSLRHGASLSYLPRILPLPAGESQVKVFLVSPSNEWRELTQSTLRVKAPAPTDAALGQPGDQAQPSAADSSQTTAAKKYAFTPSLTLGMKSQMAERHFPESNRPERPTFADMTLQASLKSEITNGWFGNQMQFDLVGSSFRKEALRFAELCANAPKVDLSSYLMRFQLSKTKFQVGHINFGTNRHLINSYGSRGVTLSIPLGNRSDLSLAALNGTSIVGWNNFFGLDRRKHQILSATLGFEFIGERPGGLLLEAGALSGSLQPIAGFNQGVINDAEQSKGGSLRLLATDKAQRFKLEGGFTRSLFTNPSDPLLNQNQPVVPVRETTRSAHYLDTSVALLRDLKRRRALSTGNRRPFGEGNTVGLAATPDAQLPDAFLAARNCTRSGVAMACLGARSKRSENRGDSLAESAIEIYSFSMNHVRAHMKYGRDTARALRRRAARMCLPVSSEPAAYCRSCF